MGVAELLPVAHRQRGKHESFSVQDNLYGGGISRHLCGGRRGEARRGPHCLPVPDPVYEPITELDARKATAPPRADVTASTDAPNVVTVLIDDIGFGTAGSFGGAIETPTLTAPKPLPPGKATIRYEFDL